MDQKSSTVTAGNGDLTNFSELNVRYEHGQSALYYSMAPDPRPCFTPGLLANIKAFQKMVRSAKADKPSYTSIWSGVKYIVLGCDTPGMFSLGGDLVLFREAIMNRDRDSLERYAHQCIDVLYQNSVDLEVPITTISLVQGRAMGGGMEAALSSTVVIAERSAQMGLPEIHFSLFPGMGAYQLLARRIGPIQAERFIKSGRLYSAVELYDMGLVDEIAPDGAGAIAVADYIRRQSGASAAYEAIHRARRIVSPMRYDDLIEVTDLWVDAALTLGKRDLRVMERFAQSQNRLSGSRAAPTAHGAQAKMEAVGLPASM